MLCPKEVYARFCTSLKADGQRLVVEFLKMKGDMSLSLTDDFIDDTRIILGFLPKETVKKIYYNWPKLVETVEIETGLVDHLFAHGVITHAEKQTLQVCTHKKFNF